MAMKCYKPKEIVGKLRQAEVGQSQGTLTAHAIHHQPSPFNVSGFRSMPIFSSWNCRPYAACMASQRGCSWQNWTMKPLWSGRHVMS